MADVLCMHVDFRLGEAHDFSSGQIGQNSGSSAQHYHVKVSYFIMHISLTFNNTWLGVRFSITMSQLTPVIATKCI
jgi:hypothetical protein